MMFRQPEYPPGPLTQSDLAHGSDGIHPVESPAERRARETFTALMMAFSYPGRSFELPVGTTNPHMAIAETLLGLDSSFFTADDALARAITQTGAARTSPDMAEFHFYPAFGRSDLAAAESAPVGTMMRPDDGATLIIGCSLTVGALFRLRGPGIVGTASMRLGDMPASFWPLRARRLIHPLGWDVLLVDGARVIGLPRTTEVEPL